VLFVVLEPNTKGGRYDHYHGCDLRTVWRTTPQSKPFNINIARWASIILEGRTLFWSPTPEEAQDWIRRVAIINLKKLAGSGTADCEAVNNCFARDTALIDEQLSIIDPTIVIVGGPKVNAALRKGRSIPRRIAWIWNGKPVIVGNHPSLRPKDQEVAFNRLVERARDASVLGPSMNR
jgi:hypothetical protein